jgi:hypothetical protein
MALAQPTYVSLRDTELPCRRSVFVLVAIVRKPPNIKASLYTTM